MLIVIFPWHGQAYGISRNFVKVGIVNGHRVKVFSPNQLSCKTNSERNDEIRQEGRVTKFYTVEPRNNSLAFKGSPSIKVNILRSQMIVFNVISPLFKGKPEIKRVIFSPNGTDEAGFYLSGECIRLAY